MSRSIKSSGVLKTPDGTLQEEPWYDAPLKKFMVIVPLVFLFGNSLVSMTINGANLSKTTYGPYGNGPVRMSTPADQLTYGNQGSYSDLWGSTSFGNEASVPYIGAVFLKSLPSFHYFSCGEGQITTAHVQCNFSKNKAFAGLVAAFVAYTAIFVIAISANCFTKYETTDLRFFINAEKFKSSRLSTFLIVLGYLLTFAGFAVGMYYARQNVASAEVYGRQLIFLFINILAFLKLGRSVFPDLKHLEIDVAFSEKIPVTPFYQEERRFSNGWGCLVRPEYLVRKLEQAVLRAYIHKAPEHVNVYGDKEKLERALLLIHLPKQKAAAAAVDDDKLPKQNDDDKVPDDKDDDDDKVPDDVVVQKQNADDGDDKLSPTLRQTLKKLWLRIAGRYLFVVAVIVLAVNSLSNVATIAKTSATTTIMGFPTNTGVGFPFLLDSVASQKYALQMQKGELFQNTTSPYCQQFLGVSSCLQANVSDVSCEFGSDLICIMPQWNMCGTADTSGVLEAGFTCSYLQSSLFYTLIYIWVGWFCIVLVSSLGYSISFDVHDVRFHLSVEHFRSSVFNRALVVVAMLYTVATGITAIVVSSGFSVITYFNVLVYVTLNIRSLSSLVSDIPCLNKMSVDFPEALFINPVFVDPTDVLYSLEQALLKTYLTGQDKHILRVADKGAVESFFSRAYLHDLSVSALRENPAMDPLINRTKVNSPSAAEEEGAREGEEVGFPEERVLGDIDCQVSRA